MEDEVVERPHLRLCCWVAGNAASQAWRRDAVNHWSAQRHFTILPNKVAMTNGVSEGSSHVLNQIGIKSGCSKQGRITRLNCFIQVLTRQEAQQGNTAVYQSVHCAVHHWSTLPLRICTQSSGPSHSRFKVALSSFLQYLNTYKAFKQVQ